MKASTKLDSAVFQLTPTRTRFDLFIVANEKKEKIASGLLIPFISHLKTAEDQINEGSYSVLLKPESGKDSSWFTKATVERFVRFVSSPEILERVYNTELAILQMDEAIAIRGNNELPIDGHLSKRRVSNEGSRDKSDSNEDQAIVLFTPSGDPTEVKLPIAYKKNSRSQLLKVLVTRKRMLQKEQEMAFARAAAAGFSVDHMAPLMSFAECFGASRLMDACIRFMDLWKKKHEPKQWSETEAEEKFIKSTVSTVVNNLNTELAPQICGLAGSTTTSSDERILINPQIPVTQQEYFPNHPTLPPSMQGNPLYQNYSQYYSPPSDDVQITTDHSKRHLKKGGKKKSGTVLIRNINYVTSKQKISSRSASDSETQTDTDDMETPIKVLKSTKGIKGKRADDETNMCGREEMINRKESDDGQWQAFQSCLLRAADKNNRFTNNDDTHGKKNLYKRNQKDDSLFVRQENQSNSSYHLDVNGLEGSDDKLNKTMSGGVVDESFIVPFRAMSVNKRTSFEMDPEKSSNRVGNQVNYEPYDLSIVREHGSDKRSTAYDPAIDYNLNSSGKRTSVDKRNKEAITFKKEQKSISVLDKKKTGGPIARQKPSKMSPLEDARARAEKLRTYKADLQKMKKEKEDAEKKRLDALKLERQKRIAARGQTMSSSLQTGKSLPTRFSPVSQIGSKFSDMEPKSSSPLQRSKVRTASLGSIDFQKASKVNKSTDEKLKLRTSLFGSVDPQKGSKENKLSSERSKPRAGLIVAVDLQKNSKVGKSSDAKGPRLTRSVSLSEPRYTTERIRRLSEPNILKGSPTLVRTTDVPGVRKISFSRNIDNSKSTNQSKVQKNKTLKRADSFGHNKTAGKQSDKKPNKDSGHETLTAIKHASEEKMEFKEGQSGNINSEEKSELASEISVVRTLPSAIDLVDKEQIRRRLQASSNSQEAMKDKESTTFSNMISDGKSHGQPKTSIRTVPKGVETAKKIHVSDLKNSKLEKIQEALKKPGLVKQSSKGFQRLLKLGNRSRTHTKTATAAANNATSSQVHTLKTLLSQEEEPSAVITPEKPTRNFSLLSTFRSKSGEKKLIT